MIPTVKTWIVTVDYNGTKIRSEVLAPTKFLARLNFRHDYIQFWGHDIISIGLKRKA